MIWLGLDFESTGLNVKEDRITEIGAVLWDVLAGKPITVLNYLIKIDQPLTPEIQALTGLTDEILREHGVPFRTAYIELARLIQKAEFLVAHNGTNFDKPLFHAECVRNEVGLWERPWIDSSTDVPYPPHITTRKLVHLAAEHAFVNPFPHRAVTDVLTMLKITDQYNYQEILKYQRSPSILIKAVVDYENRAKASSRGYRWDPNNKQWVKTIKNFQLEQEIKDCGFKVVQLEEQKNG